MCGIAGIFHLDVAKPVDPPRVRQMIDAIAHRGPDGEGVWTAPGIGLGHRRLSIIDLAGGDQPMASADGRLVTVFNGEIYNYRALRAEMEARGCVFVTHSDTECILHGWRLWGAQCLDRFVGMFAFALFDQAAQTLFLARDRLGVKPLFYAELPEGTLLFGSELKAVLAHPRMRRTPDVTAVEDFLALGYVPDDACIVAGVKKLPAGHHLTLTRGRPAPRPVRWWDVAFSADARGSADDLGEALLGHMREGVRSRMVADVPLAAFLSGGVDSSAVVALMAEASRQAVETCSIGFDVAGLDETAHARAVAERFATSHRERIVSPDDYGLIDALVHAFDEPFADPSALPTYRVCELAREPLLDHRLIAFEASLPLRMRLRSGQGKWLMKRAMRRYLPDDILYRRKQGFDVPITEWFRGPLAGEADRIARGSTLAGTGWFDAAELARVASEHRAGRADHGRLLWQLLMLDRSLARLF